MAYEIGMSAGNYGKIERGVININSSHLQKIAKVLNITVSELFVASGANVVNESDNPYGYATKAELDELRRDLLKLLKEEFEKMHRELAVIKSGTRQKKS